MAHILARPPEGTIGYENTLYRWGQFGVLGSLAAGGAGMALITYGAIVERNMNTVTDGVKALGVAIGVATVGGFAMSNVVHEIDVRNYYKDNPIENTPEN